MKRWWLDFFCSLHLLWTLLYKVFVILFSCIVYSNHLIMDPSGPAITSWLKTQQWSESPLCITQSSPLVHSPTPMVSLSYKLKQINYMSLKLQPFFCSFDFTNCKMTVVSNGQSIGGRAPVDVALYLRRKKRNVMSSSAGAHLCFCFVPQLMKESALPLWFY